MTARADIALLRFLRERTDETAVLNDTVPAGAPAPADLPARLAAAARALRTAATDDDGRTIAYDRIAAHPAYAAFRDLTAALATFDPAALGPRAERLAFWINIFNALAIEAVVRFGLRNSIREAPGFFRRAAYRIGGRRFSAEAIEHGILRNNQPPLPRLPAPFGPDDPRLALCVAPADARVHFALNCAARSCPPLRVYTAGGIDAELDAAAAAFLHGGGLEVGRERVTLSAIFASYRADFGGEAGVADWICRYLGDVQARAVRAAFAQGRVTYGEYNWNLNAAEGRDSASR